MGKDSTVVTVISKIPQEQAKREACLVVINGADLGKKYVLGQAHTVIGRSSKVDIQIDEESISRSHATIENYGDKIVARDLQSTNGTYVNDVAISERPLMDGDQIKIGRTIFKFLSGSNVEAQYHDEIYRLTTTDGLTQVYNKRFLLKEMEREMSRSLRYDRELSLIMCDIDHFKPINDTYGHLAGDHILRQLAKRIREHIRRDDIVARYGGEEFALVLPEVDKHKAGQMAEKLRKIISDQPFIFDNITIPITLSMGISDLEEYKKVVPNSSESDVNPFAFIKLSDDRLYQAKQSGRNRIVIG
ncbi:GGDEF domain-containing protein [Microvenator marinus]|jgi:diguanylate cyclase (GGDEF)-like protein|uniref:GGDEF domain-containing protein n=1 Tax=Microvenator marinus TaxID=2600177 RepID=A0A5B8XMB0_9DELT|nr:GGDEF domain-containing protein [Microvenator marinus]QED26118.1 GGDEF domain-containing protein [Microvenator marinus]